MGWLNMNMIAFGLLSPRMHPIDDVFERFSNEQVTREREVLPKVATHYLGRSQINDCQYLAALRFVPSRGIL